MALAPALAVVDMLVSKASAAVVHTLVADNNADWVVQCYPPAAH